MWLGPAVDRRANALWSSHNGRNRGFDTVLIADAKSGDGVTVTISGNDNSLLSQGNCCRNRIVNFIAGKYKWRDYPFPESPETVKPVDVDPVLLSALTGRYEFQNPMMMTLGVEGGRVYT